MSLAGEPDGPPTKAGISYVDHSGGITAALGVCAALVERARTGVGTHVDLALFDVQISMLTYLASWQRNRGATFSRTENSAHPSLVPAQNFRTADGHLALFIGNDGMWRRFVQALADPFLADDRFTEPRRSLGAPRRGPRPCAGDPARCHEPRAGYVPGRVGRRRWRGERRGRRARRAPDPRSGPPARPAPGVRRLRAPARPASFSRSRHHGPGAFARRAHRRDLGGDRVPPARIAELRASVVIASLSSAREPPVVAARLPPPSSSASRRSRSRRTTRLRRRELRAARWETWRVARPRCPRARPVARARDPGRHLTPALVELLVRHHLVEEALRPVRPPVSSTRLVVINASARPRP